MKKLFVLLLSVAMVLGVCAGCSPKILDNDISADYDVNVNLSKDVEGEVTILVPSDDGGFESGLIDALTPGFKELYPNVTVRKVTARINDESYMQSISNLVQSETLPDLVYTNTAYYYYLVSSKAIVTLEPYYEATKEAGTLNLEADYYSNFFDMCNYEDQRYVVPRNADSVVTYYNKSILNAAGIVTDGPNKDARLNNDWTWEDFLSLNRDVVKLYQSNPDQYNGYYGIRHTVFDWESVFNPIMLSYGSSAYENGQVAIDSEATVSMLEMLKQMVSDRIVPAQDSGSMANFTSGSCAFEFSSFGPDRYDDYQVLKDNYDILPFPAIGDNPKAGSGLAGWGISSQTEVGTDRDLAWAFLHYMISEEGQLAMIRAGNSTPSVLRSITESEAWAVGYEDLNLEAFTVHEDRKVTPGYFKGFDPQYMFDIQGALQSLIHNTLTSNTTVAACIAEAVTDLSEAVGLA